MNPADATKAEYTRSLLAIKRHADGEEILGAQLTIDGGFAA